MFWCGSLNLLLVLRLWAAGFRLKANPVALFVCFVSFMVDDSAPTSQLPSSTCSAHAFAAHTHKWVDKNGDMRLAKGLV